MKQVVLKQILVSPAVRLSYMVASLLLLVAVLFIMEKLHRANQQPNGRTRGVPFNIMRGLMLSLFVAASTFVIYLVLPITGLPPDMLMSIHARDIAGLGATLCFLYGFWELFVQRGSHLRGRGRLTDFQRGDYSTGEDEANGETISMPRPERGDQAETRH